VLIAAPSKSAESPSFCLDRTETSEKSYRGRGSQRPATSVSWRDAAAFCAKHAGRLPTEAEWVRAAMGDGARDYPWGSAAPTCDRVNTNACEGVTRFVDAAGDVTPGGVVGLGGNVSEWTADAWSGVPGARVVRGGAFDKPASSTSNAFRTGRDWNESYRDGALGFRCAYDVTFE
jgi:formylglycine-generating enzyme required for sulfatase activity